MCCPRVSILIVLLFIYFSYFSSICPTFHLVVLLFSLVLWPGFRTCPIHFICPFLDTHHVLDHVLECVLFYLFVLLFSLVLWQGSRMCPMHFICPFLLLVFWSGSKVCSAFAICPTLVFCPKIRFPDLSCLYYLSWLLVLNQPSPYFSTLFYCSVTNTMPNKMTIKDKQKIIFV